jgi:DNA repair exonuclease SbcCD ATPase subunit
VVLNQYHDEKSHYHVVFYQSKCVIAHYNLAFSNYYVEKMKSINEKMKNINEKIKSNLEKINNTHEKMKNNNDKMKNTNEKIKNILEKINNINEKMKNTNEKIKNILEKIKSKDVIHLFNIALKNYTLENISLKSVWMNYKLVSLGYYLEMKKYSFEIVLGRYVFMLPVVELCYSLLARPKPP